MRSLLRQRIIFVAFLPLILAMLACGAGGTVTVTATKMPSTATPTPSATVKQVTAAQHFADSKSGGTAAPCANGDPLINGDCGVTLTATCASGDVVLGGGWLLDDPLAFVTSNYPANATTWSVTAHDEGQDGGSHPVTVTVYAECLHANFDAGVNIASSTPIVPNDSNWHEVTVNCPTGSVLTGGGFRGSNSIQESKPASNGWSAGLAIQLGASAHPSLYALCASKHLSAAATSKTTATPTENNGAGLTAGCPPASLLASGGVNTTYGTITSQSANGAQTQWQVQISQLGYVGGPPTTYTLDDYAICVAFH